MQDNNLEELAAVLNGMEMTDENGEPREEQPFQSESATDEQEAPIEESDQAEKPIESPEESTQESTEDEEHQLAEDETGKKYVPQKRFNKVYGQLQALKRERDELMRNAQAPTQERRPVNQKIDKSEVLEIEMLKTKYPQFDPESDSFSPELDVLGGQIHRANPGISRLESARRALAMARDISQAEFTIKQQAKQVKAYQSDSGITSRVTNRQSTQQDPSSMGHDELEAYMKAHGLWDA